MPGAGGSTPQKMVLRALIALMAADGEPNAGIARELGVCVDTVRKWRARFCNKGIDGLADAPRSGRPPVHSPSEVAHVKAWACGVPAQHNLPLSTVRRWLAEEALKPWRYQSWIFVRDTQSAANASVVLDLYARTYQGAALGASDYVISADEKPSIQARDRCHATAPAGPGRPMRVNHDYRRVGALARSFGSEDETNPQLSWGFVGFGCGCSGYLTVRGWWCRGVRRCVVGSGWGRRGSPRSVRLAVLEVVAGQGGQVGQQCLVGAGRQVTVGGGLAGRFGPGGGRAGRLCDGILPVRRVLVGVGQRRPRLAQVSGEVGGEHADQHVRLDPVGEAVVDRAQVQVDCLEGPEVAFDAGEVLVGVDHGGGVELVGAGGGAQGVDPVEGGLGVDPVPVTGHRQ